MARDPRVFTGESAEDILGLTRRKHGLFSSASQSPRRRVTLGAACCECPLRARCTSSRRPHVHLHEHEALQRAHRQRATDPGFLAFYYTHRPMVERWIAWLVRGNRRVHALGLTTRPTRTGHGSWLDSPKRG